MSRYLACSLVAILVLCASCAGAIIDHHSIDGVATLPQSTMDAIGQQTWFFTHASVGGNMMSGMADLHTVNPTRYQFTRQAVTYLSGESRAADVLATTTNGVIYDCNRSNPGWQNKLTIFENSLNTSGWTAPKIDLVLNKLCYIDQAASATDYLNSMSSLETAYPTTRFVYMTMPLTGSEDLSNRQRNDFNNTVRAYCLANDKLLFDIADMEAHDPSGNPSTFTYSGSTYQKLYSGYTTDNGHLNDAANIGRQRIAMGWYATAAAALQESPIVPEPSTISLVLCFSLIGWIRLVRPKAVH